MAKRTALMKRLVIYFDNTCHYCGERCNNRISHPRQATKDHIVPRYFGGKNVFENYVLACADCNSKRGNFLFECECILCGPPIEEALRNQHNINHVFKGLLEFNKPRIYKVPNPIPRPDGQVFPWNVHLGSGRKCFKTFDEALAHAMPRPTVKETNE